MASPEIPAAPKGAAAETPVLVRDCAKFIFEAFDRYNNNFRLITKRARTRFEAREWEGQHRDLAERIDLYEKAERRVVASLERTIGDKMRDPGLWRGIKAYFGERIQGYPDGEFAKTFFNSVTRRVFNTVGLDTEREFTLDLQQTTSESGPARRRSYLNWGALDKLFADVLLDFPFAVPWEDSEGDVAAVAEAARNVAIVAGGGQESLLRVDFIDAVFYQSTRAYLVGRMVGQGWASPLILALRNDGDCLNLDAVLTDTDDVSILFSFTRSYFFVDLDSVESVVRFLHLLVPAKPLDELYTVLGRARQGKTERYRTFSRHLAASGDEFVHAPGEAGLVMLVFTLPSYDLVFKVIRDEFGYPKDVKRQEVKDKYDLVFKHDRAGRLIDTQEFRNLKFPAARFESRLLYELLESTSDTVHREGDNLIFDHLYIERRVHPLNLFLEQADDHSARLAVLDYGQCIRDLAMTNVFPGDLLIKNFGVTRHGRVIFYDYDELCLLTELNFREIPESDDIYDEMRADTWYYVGENDIFPEQFMKFLAMDPEYKKLFLTVHQDLLTAAYWRRIRAMHLAGDVPAVIPYHRSAVPVSE